MIKKIISKIKENKPIFYGILGVSLLSAYFCYGRKAIYKSNNVKYEQKTTLLDITFQQLLKVNKQTKLIKIVFTESQQSEGNYRKMVIEKLRLVMQKKNIGVLINCSPKKLLDSGCQAFLQSFENDDDEWADYIVNFLKTELLIEDTIQKIQAVSNENKAEKRFALMLCDNNCLDMKRIISPNKNGQKLYVSEKLTENALQKLNIKQADLYNLYHLVVHFEQEQETKIKLMQPGVEDKKLEEIWTHPQFKGKYKRFGKLNNSINSNQIQQSVNKVIYYLEEEIQTFLKDRANKEEKKEKKEQKQE